MVVANVKEGPVMVLPPAAIVVVTPCLLAKASQSEAERYPFWAAVEVAKLKVQAPEEEAMVKTPPVVPVENVAAR